MQPFRNFTTALALSSAALSLAPSARACGPDFPNAYLAEGSVSLLSAPEGYFAAEIAKLAPPQKTGSANDPMAKRLAAASNARRANELTETGVLRLELARRGLKQERIDALAAELETTRAAIFAKDWSKPPLFSGDMPAEFALYLKGAIAYWKNDHHAAREQWTKLLALPENDRRHYTVNATYMIGRTYVPDDPAGNRPTRTPLSDDIKREMLEGAKWLRQARNAAAAGFEDLSNLAEASLGWEARAYFFNKNDDKAVHLYLQQHAANDNSRAVISLRAVAQSALEDAGKTEEYYPESYANLRHLAKDELSRRVITLYLLARFGTNMWSDGEAEKKLERQSRAWAEILAEAKLRDLPDTDRLAWLAYQAGYFDLAAKWLETASGTSVSANWIRAKLALRAGDSAKAETFLEKVTASDDLAGEARPVAWADLGRVRMGTGKYAAALDALIKGGHWEDSAYIAERVLTLDELQQYVDAHCPEYESRAAKDRWGGRDEKTGHESTRHLLARRLARANKPELAQKYFPEDALKNYTAYIADVRKGFDNTLPTDARAAAFWRAAQNARANGMEMLGTELTPDFFIWGGSYSYDAGGIPRARRGKLRLEGGPGAPTPGELERVENAKVPGKRYHYRYRAAELGWWAASLMPNDSDETARVLNLSGLWIKNHDPREANKFYRAIVIRCGNTALGKAAAAKNWFVELERAN
ncbi:MAG: hypothetical protein LBM04_00695 [Opitutaceae bacterium]|jgi:hypothetical protein|nr:hypothetical protein [Opitutaceae bacterium]